MYFCSSGLLVGFKIESHIEVRFLDSSKDHVEKNKMVRHRGTSMKVCLKDTNVRVACTQALLCEKLHQPLKVKQVDI